LIAFHFQETSTVSQGLTPVFYAVAMATGAIAFLVLGKLLDKLGLTILLIGFGAAAFFAPLVFVREALRIRRNDSLGNRNGSQDSCLKAVLYHVLPSEKRSTGFGVFDTGFGIACLQAAPSWGCSTRNPFQALLRFP